MLTKKSNDVGIPQQGCIRVKLSDGKGKGTRMGSYGLDSSPGKTPIIARLENLHKPKAHQSHCVDSFPRCHVQIPNHHPRVNGEGKISERRHR